MDLERHRRTAVTLSEFGPETIVNAKQQAFDLATITIYAWKTSMEWTKNLAGEDLVYTIVHRREIEGWEKAIEATTNGDWFPLVNRIINLGLEQAGNKNPLGKEEARKTFVLAASLAAAAMESTHEKKG